jgi:simple sugar transport system ATP-binding protein
MMASDFLLMENISKQYAGVKALDGVDFSISMGEIHCLAGTNGSGKSTLIKIISGVERHDPGGTISIGDSSMRDYSAIDSIRHGIEVIYQDLSLFPNLTVAENIALSAMVSRKRKVFTQAEYSKIAMDAMNLIGINLPPDATVGRLSVSEQQLVAICRALTGELKLLIMDEPTTALTKKEVDRLLGVVKDLRTRGISTLFVSHKLQELMQVADRVTVLRDGRKIGCYPASELDSRKIEFMMTGTNFEYSERAPFVPKEKPLLEVVALSKKGNFKDITFSLFPGEIVGITGMLGSGRSELALALFGMNMPDSGHANVLGDRIDMRSARSSIQRGIAYVPEDRLTQGLVMPQSVGMNTIVTVIERLLTRFGFIDHTREKSLVGELVQRLKIKVPSVGSPVATLSGGNQQKVVLAKWIATKPRLLILDGPTVGIDIAAKGSIHEFIKELAAEGLGVLLISDEVSEVANLCHRVLVMSRGRIAAEFRMDSSSEAEISKCIELTA